ncbi:hypothetical protein FisN_13Hh038 [Fistulifera solaris]|jgi:hypothetical protein|uniref:Uncharacterized protein n=1 Tax=Fistulifera solaris TaxID=1519565 RepID=A0A1Z5KNF4_FISSO|nr:hypothetical protein FisN_13Hh038 [Fistulifera solaris]|eukprot:GAX27854.1 hypothetical protein FisN_13Hh038 [Fistulifera solaris]
MMQLTFFRVWFLSGLATVLLPLVVFSVARLANTQTQEEMQQEALNAEYYGPCKWYQFRCKRNNGWYYQAEQHNEADRREENGAPWWWFGRERRPEDRANPALIFTYSWSVLVFAFILHYGYNSIRDKQEHIAITALAVFANLSFILMVLLQGMEGVVEVDGPQLEENGFCGQVGVLMFLTYFFWVIFSLVFMWTIRKKKRDESTTLIEVEPYDYRASSDDPEDQPQKSIA